VTGKRFLRLAASLVGFSLLGGCTAPLQRVNAPEYEEPKEKPVTVRLPVLSPLKIESPPNVPPPDEAVTPSDVQDGIARSTKMFELSYSSGKSRPPLQGGDIPLGEQPVPELDGP
jgi:hypothetical protein